MNKKLRGYGMGYKPYGGRRRKNLPMALLCLLLATLALFAALEVHIAARGKGRPLGEQNDAKLVVIFGCQVLPDGAPSQTLRDRLDTALTYLDDHPDAAVFVAGGKGEDEPVSEARCMSNYLRDKGFEGDIYLEDQSKNTWQNIRYTNDLIWNEGYDGTDNIMAVSSAPHLARIEMLFKRATGARDQLYTLPAPITYRPAAVQNFFREPLALVKSWLADR